MVGKPSAGGQGHGVASADDRLVADADFHKIGGKVGVAVRSVGKVGNHETRGSGRTQVDSVAVTVGNTVGKVAGDTVMEGSRAGEVYHHLGVVAVAYLPRGILHRNCGFGVYNYLVRNCRLPSTGGATAHGDDTCVAVALVASLGSTVESSVGESRVACHGAGVGKRWANITRTSEALHIAL